MRVHLIKTETIEDFALLNPQSRIPLAAWLSKLKFADWQNPADIQDTFLKADLLGSGTNRVVFNIGGNNYRMICKYLFGDKQVHLFICWLGSHAEYDQICKNGNQFSVKKY